MVWPTLSGTIGFFFLSLNVVSAAQADETRKPAGSCQSRLITEVERTARLTAAWQALDPVLRSSRQRFENVVRITLSSEEVVEGRLDGLANPMDLNTLRDWQLIVVARGEGPVRVRLWDVVEVEVRPVERLSISAEELEDFMVQALSRKGYVSALPKMAPDTFHFWYRVADFESGRWSSQDSVVTFRPGNPLRSEVEAVPGLRVNFGELEGVAFYEDPMKLYVLEPTTELSPWRRGLESVRAGADSLLMRVRPRRGERGVRRVVTPQSPEKSPYPWR